MAFKVKQEDDEGLRLSRCIGHNSENGPLCFDFKKGDVPRSLQPFEQARRDGIVQPILIDPDQRAPDEGRLLTSLWIRAHDVQEGVLLADWIKNEGAHRTAKLLADEFVILVQVHLLIRQIDF